MLCIGQESSLRASALRSPVTAQTRAVISIPRPSLCASFDGQLSLQRCLKRQQRRLSTERTWSGTVRAENRKRDAGESVARRGSLSVYSHSA